MVLAELQRNQQERRPWTVEALGNHPPARKAKIIGTGTSRIPDKEEGVRILTRSSKQQIMTLKLVKTDPRKTGARRGAKGKRTRSLLLTKEKVIIPAKKRVETKARITIATERPYLGLLPPILHGLPFSRPRMPAVFLSRLLLSLQRLNPRI